MAKKHSDKELQNMSVEELQSLMNDILPQKERPNYDTYTGGGRDGGVCCDDTYGCCDSYCTLCDGICSAGETCLPDNYIDPALCNSCCVDGDCEYGCLDSFVDCATHGCEDSCNSCCPIIEYPSFTVDGGWDGSPSTIAPAWKFVAYPYADEFHDGTSFIDILENAMSEPFEDGSNLLTMIGSGQVGYAYKNGGEWINASGDISSTVKGMGILIASVGSNKTLNWGT
jgi:hypothetical protein